MSKNRDRQRENRRKYKGGVFSKTSGYRDTAASAAINAVMKHNMVPDLPSGKGKLLDRFQSR